MRRTKPAVPGMGRLWQTAPLCWRPLRTIESGCANDVLTLDLHRTRLGFTVQSHPVTMPARRRIALPPDDLICNLNFLFIFFFIEISFNARLPNYARPQPEQTHTHIHTMRSCVQNVTSGSCSLSFDAFDDIHAGRSMCGHHRVALRMSSKIEFEPNMLRRREAFANCLLLDNIQNNRSDSSSRFELDSPAADSSNHDIRLDQCILLI